MSLGVGIEQNLAPAHLPTEMGGSVPVNPILAQSVFNPNVKDSRWLTLEVCREFTRNKCTRTDTECKFAHPPPHVEVQNGRVTCCFDSIKGKCQRKEPPCKYLHPPQHLREQLLQNGRNNLILKQFQTQALTSQFMMPGIYPNMAPHNLLPYSYHTPSPFISPMPGMMAQLDANGGMPQVSAPMSVSGVNSVAPSQKMQRNDRLEAVNGNQVSDSSYSNVASSLDALASNGSQYPFYSLQPGAATQLVEVLQGQQGGFIAKKRQRDPHEELLMGMNHGGVPGGVMPMIKHRAVDKSGVPVYQPTNAAGAYQPLMQFSQQQFVPVAQTLQYYRGDQTSPYSPVAGTMPRF